METGQGECEPFSLLRRSKYVLTYGKVRLKGFNDKQNKNYKPINDYRNIDTYLKDSCAYGCSYFIIKKIEKN